MKYKAVLFDLDGTLLDTLNDLADSMNAVLSRAGHPTHPVGAYRYFVGNGMRNLVKRALPDAARSEAAIDAGLAEMKKEYSVRWANKTKPYEGIPELLDGLSGRGLRLAVLSNKADEFTRLMVEKLLPDWKFDAVAGERAGIPRKPDPGAAVGIASGLGITAKEFLYLGDTDVDMQTATAAGMYAVGVLWGFRKPEELVEGGARILIPRPAALLDLLD